MEMDNAVPYEELEQRRRKASEARKAQMVAAPTNPETDSEALNVINEIFNPTFKLPPSTGPYKLPDAATMLQEYDVRKLAELKEVFALFDTDCDGLISKDDLRFTIQALGGEVNETIVENMLKEASSPLNYDAFVDLMSRHTVELDPEDVLLEAWSKWDDYGTGKINERKIYEELLNYGDKMTSKEVNEALQDAPKAKPKTLEEPPMIDYPAFCRNLCGLRKRKEE